MMVAVDASVKVIEQGFPAVLVENPNGELVPYFIDAAELEAGERVAFVLMKMSGDKYRVSLTVHRGWVCDCKDWAYCTSRKRARQAGSPCKHVVACLALLAEDAT